MLLAGKSKHLTHITMCTAAAADAEQCNYATYTIITDSRQQHSITLPAAVHHTACMHSACFYACQSLLVFLVKFLFGTEQET